jgi:hypothetical protein
LNQAPGQAQEPQAAPNAASANNGGIAATGDQFTPSAQHTAQAAGLFTVNQVTLFSAAAEFLLAQAPATQANTANTAAQPANAGNAPVAAVNLAAALRRCRLPPLRWP